MGHAPRQHLLRIRRDDIGAGRIVGAIDAFVRVRLDVVEKRRQRGEMDVLVAPAADHAKGAGVQSQAHFGLGFAVEYVPVVDLPVRFLAPIVRVIASKERSERSAIALQRRADLLLLDADPLADVANVRLLAGVSLRGTWLSAGAINAMLEEIEAVITSGA